MQCSRKDDRHHRVRQGLALRSLRTAQTDQQVGGSRSRQQVHSGGQDMIGPTSTGTTTITSIDVHAEGEAGRILLGAHLLVRGATWPERMRWCETRLDWLRRLLLREP